MTSKNIAILTCCCVLVCCIVASVDGKLVKSSSSFSPSQQDQGFETVKFKEGETEKVFIVDESAANHDQTVRAALLKRGWTEQKRAYHPQFNLKWTWTWGRARPTSDAQWVNHFPDDENEKMTTKDSLYIQLKKAYPLSIVHTLTPPTFVLSSPSETREFLEFAAKKPGEGGGEVLEGVVDLTASGKEMGGGGGGGGGVFIAKPARSAKGLGIQIFRNAAELLDFAKNASIPYVAQEYIHPPLLYHGHKFDLRIFVLLTSLSPPSAHVYGAPYARICSGRYSMDNISDPFVHLTNHQVQKKSPLPEVMPFNQLSFDQVSNYISEQRKWDRFWRDVKDLLAKTILAWPASAHRPHTFELVGIDVLIDANLKPWVIEINRSPGLHMITPTVKAIYPSMIDEMFSVVFDEKWEGKRVWEPLVANGKAV